MSRFAISSWSVDHLLQSGQLPLLDLPSHMTQHDIRVLELCHFHLTTTDDATLDAFKHKLHAAGVELYSVLIDTGDIAAPDDAHREADVEKIKSWIDVAAQLGASRVRIDAGLQPPTSEVIDRSARHLHALANYANARGVKAITENWHATSVQPECLIEILDRCAGLVGLCADTGNAELSKDKYATLAMLLPRATSVHFKAQYESNGSINEDDLRRCTDLMHEARFDGVVTLIYGNKEDEWRKIELLRDVLQLHLNQ